jgi:hypothetical protein
MDSKFFRIPTKPNFYAGLEAAPPVDVRDVGTNQELPAPDSRFPGWAAPMSDARLVTDYQPHCAKNVPAGQQFPTKAWMQRNASDVIDYSRKIYAQRMGGFLAYDSSVVPPPALIVDCKPGGCSRSVTEAPGGIGMERAGAECPELFGTFSFAGMVGPAPEKPRVCLTTKQEGGRNSIRGVF